MAFTIPRSLSAASPRAAVALSLAFASLLASFTVAAVPSAGQEWTQPTIVLGQSAAFTGAVAPQVKELTAGALAYFDLVNRGGGVHGRKIVLESLDDGFDPKRAAENTRKLIEEKKVFSLFLYRATPTTEAALPIFTAAKVPLVGPSTGAQSMYSPVKPYLFPVRPSYHAETRAVISHLQRVGLKRIAIFHADDSFGNDGLAGYKRAMEQNDLQPVATATFKRGTVEVEPAVATIAAAKPQVVVMVCAANAGVLFIKQMRDAAPDTQFVLLSNVSSQAFIKDLGAAGHGVMVSQVSPFPFVTSTPLLHEFHTALKQYGNAEPSYAALEGFVSAKVMVEGLKRAGKQLSREKFIAAMEGIHDYDMGGVKVNYSPTERTGTNFVELSMISKKGTFIR